MPRKVQDHRIPAVLRETLVSLGELAIAWGPFLLIGIALLVAAYWFLDPTPPRQVVLATGPERSAYAEFGSRYAQELKRYGIEVELRETPGARENLRLLRDPKQRVDVAFVQGGASERIRPDEKEEAEEVVSLGSLFFEPVWLFYRGKPMMSLANLRGQRVNVGARGSGTPGLTARLLDANQIEREELKRSNLGDTEAVVALLEGKLDALFLVSAPESPFVQMLLQTPGIHLFEFLHAEAYARRYRYISPVTLPRGVAHLALDVPSRDVPLIATTTSLVAREDTHPALMQLFVQAAARIHSGSGWIVRAGRFPSGEHSEFPLAKDADRYYRSGPPFLQRYLPFSIANLIDRMWVALFSIVAVLIPVSRLVPPLYQHRVRSRVFRWYRNLRQIEQSLERKDASAAELLADLDKLEAQAARIVVPLSYADELYALRAHINMVRQRLTRIPSTSEARRRDPAKRA